MRIRNLSVLAAAFALAITAVAAPAAGAAPLKVVDLGGKTLQIPEPGAKATVLLFVSTSCPYSKAASPAMAKIADSFSSKGVDFLFVYGNPTETAAGTRAQAKEYGFDGPVVLDHKQVLVRATGATNTPEAFVVTPAGKFAYYGRIDNSATQADPAKPTTHDLVQALDSVLAGKTPPHAFEQPVGCAIPGSGSRS